MKEKRFVLEHGDTDPSTIEYGKKVILIIHEKVVTRNYPILFCNNIDCPKQLIARLLPCHPNDKHKYSPEDAYRLETVAEFKRRSYCNLMCSNKHKKVKMKGKPHIKTKPKEGYPVIEWTKKQSYAYARRCVNP